MATHRTGEPMKPDPFMLEPSGPTDPMKSEPTMLQPSGPTEATATDQIDKMGNERARNELRQVLLREDRLKSENAALRDALDKCRREHADQAIAWGHDGDPLNADYHRKWALFCAKAINA